MFFKWFLVFFWCLQTKFKVSWFGSKTTCLYHGATLSAQLVGSCFLHLGLCLTCTLLGHLRFLRDTSRSLYKFYNYELQCGFVMVFYLSVFFEISFRPGMPLKYTGHSWLDYWVVNEPLCWSSPLFHLRDWHTVLLWRGIPETNKSLKLCSKHRISETWFVDTRNEVPSNPKHPNPRKRTFKQTKQKCKGSRKRQPKPKTLKCWHGQSSLQKLNLTWGMTVSKLKKWNNFENYFSVHLCAVYVP